MANLTATPAGDRPAVPSRRRLLRLRRTLTVGAALMLAAPAVVFLGVRLATPSDGAHLRPGADAVYGDGLLLEPLAEGPLEAGDVVLEVAGVAVPALAQRLVGGDGPRIDDATWRSLRALWRSGTEVTYLVERAGAPVELAVPLGRYPLGAAVARTWGTILFALATVLVASLVFARRPDQLPARILFVGSGALLGATTWSLGLQVSDVVLPTGFWLYQATTVAIFMTYWTTSFHFAMAFPEPHPWARRRAFVPIVYGVPLAGLAGVIGWLWLRERDPLARIADLAPVSGYHAAIMLAAALVALAWQIRQPRSGAARRKIRWVVFGALVTGSAGLFLYILPPLFGLDALSPNAIGAIVTLFPVAVAVAVLRDNLFDIDTLLHRTLVYGALTFGIGALYVAVVASLSALFQVRAGLGPALVATGLVAVLFQPLRERVQGAVNRLFYGERDAPEIVLGRLGERLEGTLAPEAVLPTLVETIAQALRLPYVALELDGVPPTRIEFGRPRRPASAFPLAYRGEAIGSLIVEPRGQDETFHPAERELLETIARQASVASFAVRTSEDLRRSRERLVAAREEERRRLRRDLHDGLGPALGGLTLKLDAAANMVERDPEAARTQLGDLRGQVQAAIDDLRRVVHALRPATLDDLGVIDAIRAQAQALEDAGVHVRFDAPEPMPEIPAAVEVAAFRIAQEALANVVRHAGATGCDVTLRLEGQRFTDLVLTVEDDGHGLASTSQRSTREGGGVGMASMRARATELGGTFHVAPGGRGGTRIAARLPLYARRTGEAVDG